MTREAFLLELSLKLRDLPEGELSRESIRKIYKAFCDLHSDALAVAPCLHDSQQNYLVNGVARCGICMEKLENANAG